MIIVRLSGGLGNQLFQYAFGRKLAVERNQKLMLDISLYEEMKTRTYKLDSLNICADIASNAEILTFTRRAHRDIISLGFRFFQRCIPYYKRLRFFEQSFVYDPNVSYIGKSVYLKGSWQSEKYFLPIRNILRAELTPKTPIEREYISFAESITSSNSVSLHVRRGDYVMNPRINDKHGTCSVSYYQDAVKLMNERLPSAKYYIFSDDLEWAQSNLDFIQNKQIIFHVPDVLNADAQEMWLMSQCKHHIIANSSFSWWGAWLSNNPSKIIICPQKWFSNSPHSTKDLIPGSWVQL